MQIKNDPIEIIAGPTASGKSAIATQRAVAIGGTVINADSMQIYAALPILTAQPDAGDRAQAPHDLYGVRPADEPCSAQIWRALAIDAINRSLNDNRPPIIVGGTGLYIDSLINGLSPVPDVSADMRAEAVALQARLGNPGFHAALKAIDPVMGNRLHPNDTQRLIRAWEVRQATGRSLAAWQAEPREGPPPGWSFNITLVMPERAALYARCNARFEWMLNHGALAEVEQYRHLPQTAPVTHALGFRPLRDHLSGLLSFEEAMRLGKIETRQYAKRQVTWFSHQLKPTV